MSVSNFVHIGNGLIVPLPALLAVLDLERAGHSLSLDADDVLVERGKGMPPLDEQAIENLRRWKAHAWLIVRAAHADQSRAAAPRHRQTREATR